MNTLYANPAVGISFSTAMMQSLLRGEKTVTRRPVKPQPVGAHLDSFLDGEWLGRPFNGIPVPRIRDLPMECPYGQVGGRLFVQEAFVGWWDMSTNKLRSVAEWAADGYQLQPGERMAGPKELPRWASRMDLEITSVQVQRLLDITTADILAEGFRTRLREHDAEVDLSSQFVAAWDGFYGAGAAAVSPWVWAIEFAIIPKR